MNIAHRFHDMIRHGLAFILFFKMNKAKAAKECGSLGEASSSRPPASSSANRRKLPARSAREPSLTKPKPGFVPQGCSDFLPSS